MVSTDRYRLEERGGFLLVVTKETIHCPVCGEALLMRGRRERKLISSEGTKAKDIIVIRRLYCSACKRIHHELPDCIVPYKRHCRETIEKIVKGKAESVPCENRTVRRVKRWWMKAMPYFMNIIKSLAQKYEAKMEVEPAFYSIIRAVVNSNNWIFTS